MKELETNSQLFGGNAPFVEDLYEQYLFDPNSVDAEWRAYFDKLQLTPGSVARDVARGPIEESFRQLAKQPVRAAGVVDEVAIERQVNLLRLISAYRIMGSRGAQLDPLERMDKVPMPQLDPKTHNLSESDMAVKLGTNIIGLERATPAEVLGFLKQTYCGNIGLEYMHVTNAEERAWVQEFFESRRSQPSFNVDQKKHILKQVTAAETLEQYLHKKYVGQKRFSLEGGDSMIPAVDYLAQAAGASGVKEIVIGMAHRGRLNMLVNILGKMPRDLFGEFEGRYDTSLASGDVKYHMGFSSDIPTAGGPLHLTLAFNPSHLEIVNPVVEGSVRARQHRRKDLTGDQVLPLLIHGDSAFIGLGTNQGTFNMSQTRGYGTGGTVHLVINNQVGFTTSDIRDNRSTIYSTDIAKMVEAPIFHVNGDDPEAVCLVTDAALQYRQKFHKDVVIDLVCYRKHGHNEADDPFVTQPMMYRKVAQHPGARRKYADRLIAEGVVTEQEADGMIQAYRDALDRGEHVEKTTLTDYKRAHAIDWTKYLGTHWRQPVVTSVPHADLVRLTDKFTTIPADFKLRANVEKIIKERKAMVTGEVPVDFGMAEHLAYATLLTEGIGVRLSGEDSGRGTFNHRHAVLHDQNREKWDHGVHVPLQNLSENQGPFRVIDSILNEEAVLAFEYGYACSEPGELVIWEAQFGDFANGAQVVIDQFIASGETKWGRLCGLTMILPHGYDGQGPEHSSARVERYLQLCAEHNIQVLMLSEAAQMYHALRRQMLRPYRKPLIIIMSKKLLKAKNAASPIEQFTSGEFRSVIGEAQELDNKKVKRVICCAGQVYYDLLAGRTERELKEIAIVRIEQLYPFPADELKAELSKYPNAKEIMWAQEEPRNQGAWHQLRHRLEDVLEAKQVLLYAGRPSSASPAVGYMSKHNAQLKAFVEEAMKM